MKISIITATYNSDKTLKDTFNSILSQSSKDYECIVVDGGSSDNTLNIIKEYEAKFSGRLRWISEKDKGLYDAMNKGIQMASGDVIGILNSDDFYFDDKVLESISIGIKDVDAVYGDLVFVDSTNTSKIIRTWKGSQYKPNAFSRGWVPAHPTFYARKELFERFGGFDTSLDISADFELMLRFIEKGRATNCYIPRTFVRMRLGGESTGSIKKIMLGNHNILKAFDKNGLKRPPFYLIRRLTPKVINLLKIKLGFN